MLVSAPCSLHILCFPIYILLYLECKKRIQSIFEVIKELDMFYGQILHNEKMCKLKQIPSDRELMADFKEAYDADKVCYSI